MSEGAFVDRGDWYEGPWDTEEIDKRIWKDAATGLGCMIYRGACGQWCGYVGVPKGHRFYGIGTHSRVGIKILWDLDCHGGANITFKKDALWWFGFDCAHVGDITPMQRWANYGEYRNIEYVTKEVEELAKKLA